MLVSGPTDTLGSCMRGCNDTELAGLHLQLGAHCECPPGLPAPEQVLQSRCPCQGEVGMGSKPGLERFPGERSSNPLQYFCLEIPWTEEPGRLEYMGLQKSLTQLND